MYYFHIFLFYSLFASASLFLGFGINRAIEITPDNIMKCFNIIMKSVISIFITTILSSVVINLILIPINLQELFPLIVFLIFIAINTFIEALIRITTKKSMSEFYLSYLIVILTIIESTNIPEAMLISVSVMLSFIILIPFIFASHKRLFDKSTEQSERMNVYILISIAILMLATSVFDITIIN